MSRPKTRTRTTPVRSSISTLTIKEHHEVKNGKGYSSFMVQGWKEDGKWKRKKFKDRADAERFVALKRVELENAGRKLMMTLSPLTEVQTNEAVAAFDSLGEAYTLKQAVDFFLKNHRPPEFTINLEDGIKLYLDDKERDGVRSRTLRGVKGILKAFATFSENSLVHELTPQTVELYLRGLRALDGVSPAKRKSWNNQRNEISQFMAWSSTEDLATHRPWRFNNPVENIRRYSTKQVAEQRPPAATTSPEDVQHLFSILMRYRKGALVKAFALQYFAGIRPEGELKKLAKREKELINLKTGIIHIPAEVSKTKDARQVLISDNLKKWLLAYSKEPIIPTNYTNVSSKFRTHLGLKHDETRHSFISYHVAIHRSVGDAALQAGNSESMVKKHYLNLHHRNEGEAFFSLVPDMKKRISIIGTSPINEESKTHLKAI